MKKLLAAIIVCFNALPAMAANETSVQFGRAAGSPPTICVYDRSATRPCNTFLTVDDVTHAVGLSVASVTSTSMAIGTLTASGTVTAAEKIVHIPTVTEGANIIPGIYQQYTATGSGGTSQVNVINAFNLLTDDLAMGGPPGDATLILFSVLDIAFGGTNAKGNRVGISSDIEQSAATSASNISTRFYIGMHSTINSASGDGGGVGTEKGSYLALWTSPILRAAAANTVSLESAEMDITAVAGSSVKYKAILQLSHAAFGTGPGLPDAVQGSVVDADLWIFNDTAVVSSIGSKDGILFGRSDGFGGLGVSSTGTLIRTAAETATIANAIDFSGAGLTITGFAWKSPGATIDGSGNAAFASATAQGAAPVEVALSAQNSGSTNDSSSGSGAYVNHTPTFTIPANFMTSGRPFRVIAHFQMTSGSAPPVLTHRLLLGSTVIGTAGAITPVASQTNVQFALVWIFQATQAPGGAANVQCTIVNGPNAGTATSQFSTTAMPVAVATNASQAVTIATQWSAVGTGTTNITLNQLIVEALK